MYIIIICRSAFLLSGKILENKLHLSPIDYVKKFIDDKRSLLCPKTKVYIRISRIMPVVSIYHIGITFQNYATTINYDIGENNKIKILPMIPMLPMLPKSNNSHIIFWGYTDKSLDEIIDYEKKLFRNYKYILGFNDCRHYTRILANWTTNKPTPIWKIQNILLEKNARLK